MRVLLAASAILLPLSPAHATTIGVPLARDGIEIVPSYQTGVALDRSPAVLARPAEALHLEALVRATKGEAHGFAEGAFIPYLSVAYSLTKEGTPTFRKTGLLYPMAARSGPHYGTNLDMAGPGTYHLTYIVSPPTAHGMMRHADKAGGVPDWWKPITASWTFNYPDAK